MPNVIKIEGKRTYRTLKIDGNEFEFSEGFNELHTESYNQILMGKGFSLNEAKVSIQTVHDIRNSS